MVIRSCFASQGSGRCQIAVAARILTGLTLVLVGAAVVDARTGPRLAPVPAGRGVLRPRSHALPPLAPAADADGDSSEAVAERRALVPRRAARCVRCPPAVRATPLRVPDQVPPGARPVPVEGAVAVTRRPRERADADGGQPSRVALSAVFADSRCASHTRPSFILSCRLPKSLLAGGGSR